MKRFVCALAGLAGVSASTQAQAVQIWLGAQDPVVAAVATPESSQDYMQLFEPDAPWRDAARYVQVFKISRQLALGGSDATLRQIIDGLKQRKIALAMEVELVYPGADCGKGEGYARFDLAKTGERIRSLGGDLQFVSVDAPLLSGNRGSRPQSCLYPPDEIARQVAQRVQGLKAVFPNVKVGDIEPIGRGPGRENGWPAAVLAWHEVYKKVAGQDFDFFHADVDWAHPWQEDLKAVAAGIHQRGEAFGVIYDGNPNDSSDVDWTRHAMERAQMVETTLGVHVDDAVLQTWMSRPTHLLPDSQPGTMTNLVLQYARPTPTLAMQGANGRVTGTLTGPDGKPVPSAQVVVTADDASPQVVVARTLTGTVPDGAVKALFVLRVNTECACAGTSDITVGPMQYRDGGSSSKQTLSSSPNPAIHPNGDTLRIIASPSVQLALNSRTFPVRAGSSYTANIPLGGSAASVGTGYAAVLFQRADGHEIRRDPTQFGPSQRVLGTVTTGPNGTFALPGSAGPNQSIHAAFMGTNGLRGTTATMR